MRKLFAIAALACAIALGGCSTTDFGQKISGVYSAITGATVDPQSVIVASNIFDGLERTATNYLTLKKCNGSTPVCRDAGATKVIVPAIRSGRVARGNLQQFFKDHPGQLGPTGLYDALQSSISTLQQVFTQYNIGAGQ